MYFIDSDGAYAFTLGIDACEPQEHRADSPLILSVGNQNIHFLETVECTRSNDMYFHEHRLRPISTSNLDLVTHAVREYCSKLQTLSESPTSNANERVFVLPPIPAESSQVRYQRSMRSTRDRTTSRPAPYPNTSSIQQRRSPSSQSQSSTDSTNTPSRILSHSSSVESQPIASSSTSGTSVFGTPRVGDRYLPTELKQKLLDYCLEHHEGKSCYHAFIQLKNAYDKGEIQLELMPSRTTLEKVLIAAGHLKTEISSPNRTTKIITKTRQERLLGHSSSAVSQAIVLPSTSGASTSGSGTSRVGERYLTPETKQKILDYCLKNHVGKSCYHALIHLKNAHAKGEIQLDHVPCRTTLKNLLITTGHLKVEISPPNRTTNTIINTSSPELVQPPIGELEPPQESPQAPEPE